MVIWGKSSTEKLKSDFNGSVILQTKYGKIEGIINQKTSTLEWLGVPYAKPPVNELRWQAPQDPVHWEGVLKTQNFGECCPQIYEGKFIGNEDCLYLNIWRPDNKQSNLPVFVFAHGGGNTYGSGQDFKGDFLSQRTSCIIISINYRLGALGWFRHKSLRTGEPLSDSGNFGLLDILKSLKWVQENIENFGGDPKNVTLGGHSSGGRNAMATLISPLGKDLFSKVVVLSGGMTTSNPTWGEKKSSDILAKLLLEDGSVVTREEAVNWENEMPAEEIASYLRSKEATDFLPIMGNPPIKMAPFPHLFRDGHVIPEFGFSVLENEAHKKIPAILGCTASEFSIFSYLDPFFNDSMIDSTLFLTDDLANLYKETVHYGSRLYAGFNVDQTAEWLKKSAGESSIFAYRFAWGTGEETVSEELRTLFGAAHGSDIDFFTTHEEFLVSRLFPNTYYTEKNKQGRKKLNDLMALYLKNFLYSGNPNGESLPVWDSWENREKTKRVLLFNADNEQYDVHMTTQDYDKEKVVLEMHDDVPEKDVQIIEEQLFDQRFFWD